MIDEQDRYLSADERSPLVSIIIPAFNVAKYITDTLASVFAQTFKDFEVIVINDGSGDSEELECALQPYLKHIVYITQRNCGPSSARNAGIRRARGRFIALLDADDLWLPEYLKQQLRVLEADPALDLIYADALLHGETSAVGKSFMEVFSSNGPVTFEALLEQRCVVITSCVVVRRQALLDAGLFDESYSRSEDFDLWARLAHGGARLGYQQRVLAQHRLRPDSLAGDQTRMSECAVEVYAGLARKLALTHRQRTLVENQIGKYRFELELARGKRELAAGEYGPAVASFKRACALKSGLGRREFKLRIALLCLGIAPRLAQQLYLWRGPTVRAQPGNLFSPTVSESKTHGRLTL